MAHFLLFYDAAPDYLQRRGDFRDEHLRLAWAAAARGELVLGGALDAPVDGAVLLFQGEDASVAEEFARNDPYVRAGLVREWKVRPWTTVVGKQAATPVKPTPA
ncbi:hypothetical protein ARC20_15630 [Stenotrophomonas panacihumi]|uniref:YCII-related domain-containing protein n=1 Tax=Stenotrophomonas panacihumi TaxID=676599 RepID=A0A0R0A6B4_9GAMM|nr:YciI-like protein [Stenotrophomonas panacihumi]KRG38066.1 hypothetical protein ARC20_15630 [Stenotrophomonas panacihumi]PTN53537.1 hypothetical protein C9J98_15400 [Stenotrophomonas panacihumi]